MNYYLTIKRRKSLHCDKCVGLKGILLSEISQNKKDKYCLILVICVAQTVRNLPVMQKTWVQSLGWEDPLEKGIATHSSVIAWRILWTEGPGRLQSMRLQRVGYD